MGAGATLVPWDGARAGAPRAGVVFVRLTTREGSSWTRLVIAPR